MVLSSTCSRVSVAGLELPVSKTSVNSVTPAKLSTSSRPGPSSTCSGFRDVSRDLAERRRPRLRKRALHILLYRAPVITLVLVNRARFVVVEILVAEFAAALIEQSKGIVKIEIVPVNGRRFEVAAGPGGSGLRDTFPIGRRPGELVTVGEDIANARQNLRISRVRLKQLFFNLRRRRGFGCVERGERAEDRRRGARPFEVGRVFVGQSLENRGALLEMRLPQVGLRGELGRGGRR